MDPGNAGVDPMGVLEVLDTNLSALGVFEVLNMGILTASVLMDTGHPLEPFSGLKVRL